MAIADRSDDLTTTDFDVADGSEAKELDYVDGAKTAALVHDVPSGIFRELRHGAQLRVDLGQSFTVDDSSEIAVGYYDPQQDQVVWYDSKRVKTYKQLSWSDQADEDRNSFTRLDLSQFADKSAQFPEQAYLVIGIHDTTSGSTFDPAAMDVEIEAWKGNIKKLNEAMESSA